MSDRRPPNPELCKHADWLIVQRNDGYRWVTCTECHTDFFPESDAVAVVRRGVESGTIKGREIEWCKAHGRPATETTCGAFVRDREDEPNYNLVGGVRDCRIVSRLLIPVSDGGSET